MYCAMILQARHQVVLQSYAEGATRFSIDLILCLSSKAGLTLDTRTFWVNSYRPYCFAFAIIHTLLCMQVAGGFFGQVLIHCVNAWGKGGGQKRRNSRIDQTKTIDLA